MSQTVIGPSPSGADTPTQVFFLSQLLGAKVMVGERKAGRLADLLIKETTTQTFHVTVGADTNNDRPFLGSINPVQTNANTPVPTSGTSAATSAWTSPSSRTGPTSTTPTW